MNDSSIQYPAHFTAIKFPPLAEETINVASLDVHKQIPPQAPAAKPEPAPQPAPESMSTASIDYAQWAEVLKQSHEYYLLQQQSAFQRHLLAQQQIWQHLVQIMNDSSVAPMPNLAQSMEQAGAAIPQHTASPNLPGPKFSRADLEILASGKISSRFGDWFAPLDQYQLLIRMPEPPLLLADRVMGISSPPGEITPGGTIWTETDVREDAWYLHQGHMPAGIMIESGQADLLLASWMGFDFENKGERIYRLLGCELSYHGELPKPGETLCYDIHIDGTAQQGAVQLFFFHYDCKVNGETRLKVRHGQAGFFTYEELKNSGGVLWDPESAEADLNTPFDPPVQLSSKTSFSREDIEAFAAGNVAGCFGTGFEKAYTQTRSPRISGKPMLFIDQITHFDTKGGPWQRGYMRAVQKINPDDWFFKGHFKNDPCMPGTLMLEAGLQVMACYLAALGFTLEHDGWRFEPVTDEAYTLRCRGQTIPSSKEVVYEIFVWGLIAEPIPILYVDLLGTCDGLKSFHTKIGLRLIPDWPLDSNHPLLLNHQEKTPAPVIEGFTFDYASLLACAWGKPSQAFGHLYKPFDNHRKVPRLPGPPYHFMSHILSIEGPIGGMKTGSTVELEFDIDPNAWFFTNNAYPTMPFCVLMEAALQPCGWLASYIGSALRVETDLLFRNLDGTGTLTREILPTSGTLRSHIVLTGISESAGMILVSFEVNCYLDSDCIYNMNTGFGFFPKEAFANQPGLPVPEHETQVLSQASDFFVDLTTQPAAYFASSARLPKPMLLMIDRVTGFWPTGGKYQKGQLRSEKTVNPQDWFFKAHFFQDPVQPGSLGIEAMLQLLQFYMLEQNLHQGFSRPRFQPLQLDKALTWKYRGQVIPANKIISITMDIVDSGKDSTGVYATAEASLWVDGKRIYEAKNMGMKIVES